MGAGRLARQATTRFENPKNKQEIHFKIVRSSIAGAEEAVELFFSLKLEQSLTVNHGELSIISNFASIPLHLSLPSVFHS